MTPKAISDWLEVLGLKIAKVGAEWITVSCPLAQWRHRGFLPLDSRNPLLTRLVGL